MARTCVIYRKAEFSASHRYWLPQLSPEENSLRFGPTSQFPGHGHNYTLIVGMYGEVDHLGMVLNLSDVKKILRERVIQDLNFSYLNQVWPEFKQTLPTTECISYTLWQRLQDHLPLVSIKLYEAADLWAEYRGEGMEVYLTIGSHFSAAHRLALDHLSLEENTAIYGLCARPNGHGHNYGVEITVKGEMDPQTGMIVDLVKLQHVLDTWVIKPFDHTFLNKDIEYFSRVVPTAENIALRIQELLTEPIRALGIRLHRVYLQESPNNSSEVYGEYPAEAADLEQSADLLLLRDELRDECLIS
jgi:6-pyruvoyltetrahydropterin/6-carboxytetrahydropterin synthase